MISSNDLKDFAVKATNKISIDDPDYGYSHEPFQHFTVNNFLDEKLALESLYNFPSPSDPSWERTNDENIEVKKRSKWESEFDIPNGISEVVRILNSSLFLHKISSIFKINKLMSDPYFTGGGLNETDQGGLLDVHVDGNYHDASGLNRRVNAIYFLNQDWQESWGGHFGLYDNKGEVCKKKISPDFNKLFVFETSDISFHGLPDPLACPPDITRKSIILYYYTKDPRPIDQDRYKDPHSALWKKKGIKDKRGKLKRKYF